MADLLHTFDDERHFDWDFRPREDMLTGRGEAELARILVLDDDSKIWRLLRRPSGELEIETNWPDDEDLVAVELGHRDIAYVYSKAPEGKTIDQPSFGYGKELQVFRRIRLGHHWGLPIRDDGLASFTLSELASLLLELLWIRHSDDSLSIWTGGNRPIHFHSLHYPDIHDFMLELLREHAHQDSDTQPLDVAEEIRKTFGDLDVQLAPEDYRLFSSLYDSSDDYMDHPMSGLTSAQLSSLSDISPIFPEFFEKHDRLKASAYRGIGIGEVLDVLGKIDFQFRPESYWGPGTKYLRSGELPAESEDVFPDEVKIAEIYASLWWDGKEVGAETSYLTAHRLDDEFETSEEDVDDDEETTGENKIHYRVISSSTSAVGTNELGYSDQPLTLQELIDLIYPEMENVWSEWFTPEDHLVQHIQFFYSSNYYPQLEHAL